MNKRVADIPGRGPVVVWGNGLLLVLLFVFSTGYAYLNARNDWYGDIFLLTLLCLALPRLLGCSEKLKTFYNRASFFLAGYLGLALISILVGQSDYVNDNWFIKSFFRIIPVFLIVLSTRLHNMFEVKLLEYLLPGLTLILAVTILAVHYELLDKQSLKFLTPWRVVDTIGNTKVFSFYLVFMMWVAIGFLWRKGKQQTAVSIIVCFITIWALFTTTSESAQLAVICSLLVFGLAHLKIKKGRYWVYLSVSLIFLLIPLLWLIFYPIMSQNPWNIYNDSSSFLRQNWAIGARIYLYEFCSEMVRKQMIFGYGFGSTLEIPIPSGKLPGWSLLPGGHPHNLVFLILLEHGMIGFLWLSTMFVLFFNRLYKLIKQKIEEPAVWALLISGIVIFSLSFSIWYPDIVLTYGWYFVFLLILTDKITLGGSKELAKS